MKYNIVNNLEDKCFQTEVDGKLALVEYTKRDNLFIITHTEVPYGIRGRGIGSALTKALLQYIRESNCKVMPLCPFAASYIQEHPEYADIVIKREEL